MRVISGRFKGRILKGDKIKGTRPTMDKVKESLFAMVQNEVRGAICLDLFGGSGSLGIEAISNGASFCYFVDKNKAPYEVMKGNVKILNIEKQIKIMLLDYMKALEYFRDNNITFDLIFLDPPYQDKVISSILIYITENNLMKDSGQVVCEFMKDVLIDEYGNLNLIKERHYGDKTIKIYKNVN